MENKTVENSAQPNAPEATPKRRRLFRRSVWVVLIILLIAAGYAYIHPHYLQNTLKSATVTTLMQPSWNEQEIQELLAEIATLKSRIGVLEERLEKQESRKLESANTEDKTEMAALLAEIKANKENPNPDAGAEIDALKQQIAQLSQLQSGVQLQLQQQAMQAPTDMRVVAVFQLLRAKALESTGFEDSYQRFIALAQPYPMLLETAEKLEPYASAGRPTLAEIQRSYQEALKEYMREKDGIDNSLSGKVRKNLSEFITIRKLEDKGNSTLAIVNRAEQAVAAGEIIKAQQELAELADDVAPLFAAWLEEAKAYTEIPALILKIDQRIADMMMQNQQPQIKPEAPAEENHDS